MRQISLFALLAMTLLGCMRHDGSGHRSLASSHYTAKEIDQWVVAWLGQAPAMSEWITLSRIENRICVAARR